MKHIKSFFMGFDPISRLADSVSCIYPEIWDQVLVSAFSLLVGMFAVFLSSFLELLSTASSFAAPQSFGLPMLKEALENAMNASMIFAVTSAEISTIFWKHQIRHQAYTTHDLIFTIFITSLMWLSYIILSAYKSLFSIGHITVVFFLFLAVYIFDTWSTARGFVRETGITDDPKAGYVEE